MRRALALPIALPIAALALFAACSGGEDDARPPPQPPATLVAPNDAAIPDAGITVIQSFDPASGLHLDDDGTDVPTRAGSVGPHNKRTLEILLRSTPPRATVVVDGEVIGKTPTLWEGDFTGGAREFTFVLPGFALSRYKFVPTTNGIVHATMVPVIVDDQHGVAAQVPAIFLPPTQAPAKHAPPPDARVALPDATPASAPPPDAATASGTGRPVVGPTP